MNNWGRTRVSRSTCLDRASAKCSLACMLGAIDRRNIMDCILQLSAIGQLRFRNWNGAMVASGVKPSMAGDIWSHGGCSLMGICFYGISRPAWRLEREGRVGREGGEGAEGASSHTRAEGGDARESRVEGRDVRPSGADTVYPVNRLLTQLAPQS